MNEHTYNMLISPDFSPERFAGWHMFNTLIQKRAGIHIHLNTPASHTEQEEMIAAGNIDLVYANPFDASMMIREQGYRTIARPIGKSDEMVIVSSEKSDINELDDIKANHTVAMADNADVKLIGLRLLEAVDIIESDLNFEITESYQAAARQVIQGKADVGFFLAEVYEGLSKLTKMQLNTLIESDLAEITHIILVKDNLAQADVLEKVILSLHEDDEGKKVLEELGFASGFEAMHEEEAEFMMDLIETLLD